MVKKRLVAALVLASVYAGGCAITDAPNGPKLKTLVAGSSLHAPNGITFGPDGYLYAGSVGSQSVYRVDVNTGAIATVVPAPLGEADDVAFAPDGTLVWTALVQGELRALRADNSVHTVVTDTALLNPVHFTSDGRLFAAQIGFDRLYEFPVDSRLNLQDEPRLVASKIGNLNSFEITADNRLFGPLVNLEQVAIINIESGEVTTIAEGLGTVVAVNLDQDGNVWAIDWVSGNLWRIDRLVRQGAESWAAPRRVATLQPPLDNLAVGPDGAIYVSRPAHSAIDRVDPVSGEVTPLVEGQLTAPGGLAIFNEAGKEVLLVADAYGYRTVDTTTGQVTTPYKLTDFGFPAAATSAAVSEAYFAITDIVIRPSVQLIDRATGKTVARWRDIKSALGIVLAADNNPVVTDFSTGRLIALDRNNPKSINIIASDLAGPVGLVLAGNNNVFVAEALAGKVSRIDMVTGARVVVASGIDQPEGLASMADGRLAVVAAGSRELLAIDPDSGAVEVLARDLPVGHAVANSIAPVYLPSGVAAGTNRTLYISGDKDNSIRFLRY